MSVDCSESMSPPHRQITVVTTLSSNRPSPQPVAKGRFAKSMEMEDRALVVSVAANFSVNTLTSLRQSEDAAAGR